MLKALRLALGVLRQLFRDALAFPDEVGADEGQVILAGLCELRIDAAIKQDDWNASLLGGCHDGGDQRLFFVGCKENDVDTLGDIELTSATCFAAEPAGPV